MDQVDVTLNPLQEEKSLEEWIETRTLKRVDCSRKKKKRGVILRRTYGERNPQVVLRSGSGPNLSKSVATKLLSVNGSTIDATEPVPQILRYVGAAPGTPATMNTFPETTYRRGEFPKAEPPSTATWTISKWMAQMDLKSFDLTNELEMERWFEGASYKIQAHSATARTVIKVMQVMTTEQMRSILGACLLECHTYLHIEDLADGIAKRVFRGSQLLEDYEKSMFSPKENATVFLAHSAYQKLTENYQYMCRRRNRHDILGIQQRVDIIFKVLPPDLAQQIRVTKPEMVWSVMSLFEYALTMEDMLTRARPTKPAVVLASQPVYAGDSAMGVGKACWGCGGPHLRKVCPHAKDMCAICGKIGHISQMCRNKVIRDKAGQKRMVATPKQSGVVIETIIDNTIPAQLRTVAGVVERFIQSNEQEKERARERYASKKEEVQPGTGVRALPNREVLRVGAGTKVQSSGSSSSNYEVELAADDQECGLEEYRVLLVDEQESTPKRTKLMKVSINVNGVFLNCLLDTGALINCMAEETANRCGIRQDKENTINIKNVHGEVKEHKLSVEVPVWLDQIRQTNCKFALLPNSISTIISLSTMQELKLALRPENSTVECEGKIYKCNIVGVQEGKESNLPSTIQQNKMDDVKSAIEEDSKTWTVKLSEKESDEAKSLIQQFSDLWFKPETGRCTTVTMSIKVHGKPRRVAMRPTPVHLREHLNRQVDDLLTAGVIVPAPDCKWVSPCHLVPKPRSDKYRLVIDYRYINTLVEDDGYQIPNVQDLLIRLSGAEIFSLLDLNWGFWNVSLDVESQQYTGFVVPERGVFVWTVMPFGLKISPTVFQRAIEKALRPVIDKGRVTVYIDDILIFTTNLEAHMEVLQEVFTLLKEGGFFLNFSKMKLLRRELLYLGHQVAKDRLLPDPLKVKALSTASAPKEKKALLSFCAAASYLRMYIPRFAEVMEPLTRLTGKYNRFTWAAEQQLAFENVREEIANACYLTMPKWDRPFIIFTDASEVALGAALAQQDATNDTLAFISFASKKLTETQRNWSPTERELFAIVWACEHFESIIKGSRPLIYSDHASLEYLTSLNSPKVRRWAIRLSEFNPVVTKIGGHLNSVADWLSRSVPDDDEDNMPNYAYVPFVYHLVHQVAEQFTLPEPREMIEKAKLEESELPKGTLNWFNGIPYGRISRRMFVPKPYRTQLLLWFHTSRFGGHQGITRTTNRLRKFVWWPNMQLSVIDFVNSCPLCNAIKPLRVTRGEKGALEKPGLFHLISMDFIGPRTYGIRKFYILVIIDHYSRLMATVVLSSIATPAAANALRDHWVSKFGAPLAILVDKDPVFTALQFKTYVKEQLKCNLYYTSTEYPQGNGINESSHRILETAIKTHSFADFDTIEDTVACATILHNVTPNRNIGDTPASLTFGCDLHIPGLENFEPEMDEEARLTALRNFRGAKLLSKQLNELEDLQPKSKARSQTLIFKVGDIITYQLSTAEKKKATHVTRETKYTASRSFPQRVVKVMAKDLLVVPIWTTGPERRVPIEQVKLISTFIPELMREEVQQLYPSLPWVPAGEEASGSAPITSEIPEILEGPTSEIPSPEQPTRRKRRARGGEESL